MKNKLVVVVLFATAGIISGFALSADAIVDFEWTSSSGEPYYAGEEVTLTANVGELDDDSIITYEWDFGDGHTASGKTVTHQFAHGSNNVSLKLRRTVITGEETTAYAIWANSTTTAGSITIVSTENTIKGMMHSNNDVTITGSKHNITGSIEYVSEYSGPDEFTYNVTTPMPFPVHYNITDYKPGGPKAVEAQAEGKYHLNESLSVGPDTALDGLYYVNGTVSLLGNNIEGVFTIVANGDIHISGTNLNCSAYSCDLLFFSNGTSLQISQSDSYYGGTTYAPNGKIQISGKSNRLYGPIFGDTVRLSTSGYESESGWHGIKALKTINVSNEVNAGRSIKVKDPVSCYIGAFVPIELHFNVTENVSANLMVDGYEVWGKDTLSSIEKVKWLPMSSGRHVITAHLYAHNGMECDHRSRKTTIYIKKVTS
jgi:hypothetical protein